MPLRTTIVPQIDQNLLEKIMTEEENEKSAETQIKMLYHNESEVNFRDIKIKYTKNLIKIYDLSKNDKLEVMKIPFKYIETVIQDVDLEYHDKTDQKSLFLKENSFSIKL